MISENISSLDDPVNRDSRVINSNNIHPTAHRSILSSYDLQPNSTSGALYDLNPTSVLDYYYKSLFNTSPLYINLATPKSQILSTNYSGSTSILNPFKFLCMMLF